MNRVVFPAFLKYLFLTFFLSLGFGLEVHSQSEAVEETEKDIVVEDLVSLDDMSVETEKIFFNEEHIRLICMNDFVGILTTFEFPVSKPNIRE